MPHKKCHICSRGCLIDEFDVTCDECRERELEVLIGVYWMIHCFGSDYCPVGKVYSDVDPIGGIRPDPIMIKAWINKGYLELNEIGCVGVPKCLAEYLKDKGYNINRAFHATLNRVKSETMDKYRKGLMKPVEQMEDKSHVRMAFAEKNRGR